MADDPEQIVCDRGGLSLRDSAGGLKWLIRWNEITEIAAWKRDLFAIDLLCLGFYWDESEAAKVVDEQMQGWGQLIEELESRFELLPNWWTTVAFPAFVANRTTLWSRSDPT